MHLDDRMRETFAAVADALIVAPPGQRPSDLRIADRFGPEIFDRLPHDGARGDLVQLLKLLDSGPGGLLIHGLARRFVDLEPWERERALNRMSRHPLSLVRLGFKGLKSIVGLLWSNPPAGVDRWPPWDAIGYPGPASGPIAAPVAVAVTGIETDTKWETDVVVVGSGAGGAVAAAVLAEAGLDVVVLEKGGDNREADFPRGELAAFQKLYQDGALSTTRDGGLVLIAGATLGGGTVVNYTTSLPTPDEVRAEWDDESGYPGLFTGADFDASARAVMAGFEANRDNSDPLPPREHLLESGLQNKGWHVDRMPRNVVGCDPAVCGSCGFGCPIGAKRSTLRTWLPRASAAGARVVTGADVSRVIVERKKVTGVEATVAGHTLTVSGRTVVLAAGALNTPALLNRSGVMSPAVGRFLRLHPATAVLARYPDPVEPWTGLLQARLSDEFADLDGKGYGFRFETAPIHPGLGTLALGWGGGERFHADVMSLRNLSPIGILLRDHARGRVRSRQSGRVDWEYRMPLTDQQHMLTAFEKAAELAADQGADEVLAPTLGAVTWRPDEGGSPAEFADAVRRHGVAGNRVTYGSFHQMGSARIGRDRRRAVLDADGQTHGVAGLYVMDGSTFPTASGVNPMISIATIAHMLASRLAARLA